MKPFESFLAPKMEQYLAYRKALGYNSHYSHYLLLHFDRYVQKIPLVWDELNPLYFLTFRESLKKEHTTVNRIMEQVKNFFQFLVREEVIEENPVRDIPSLKKTVLFQSDKIAERQFKKYLTSISEESLLELNAILDIMLKNAAQYLIELPSDNNFLEIQPKII